MSRTLIAKCERCKKRLILKPENGDSYIDYAPLGLFKILGRVKDVPESEQVDIFDMFNLESMTCECSGHLHFV